MTLGEIVNEYRRNNNLTMDEFAKLSNLSKGYISMLEKNKNPNNGKPIAPGLDTFRQIAKAINMDADLLFTMVDKDQPVSLLTDVPPKYLTGVAIQVFEHVTTGVPIEENKDIIGTEYISESLAKSGFYFGLRINDDSMSPRICEGDIVIVRQQDDAEEGDIIILVINGQDATCKRLHKYSTGIRLLPINQHYDPLDFSNEEIKELPVQIIGKVIENRQKYS